MLLCWFGFLFSCRLAFLVVFPGLRFFYGGGGCCRCFCFFSRLLLCLFLFFCRFRFCFDVDFAYRFNFRHYVGRDFGFYNFRFLRFLRRRCFLFFALVSKDKLFGFLAEVFVGAEFFFQDFVLFVGYFLAWRSVYFEAFLTQEVDYRADTYVKFSYYFI